MVVFCALQVNHFLEVCYYFFEHDLCFFARLICVLAILTKLHDPETITNLHNLDVISIIWNINQQDICLVVGKLEPCKIEETSSNSGNISDAFLSIIMRNE